MRLGGGTVRGATASALLRWIADMAGIAPERPPTRLDEAQVLELARVALSGPGASAADPSTLVVREVVATDDGAVWVVDMATRGSGASVRVSDADGRVLEVLRRRSR